jgi:prepilin-type processing-associated H-X9-DG protein
MKLHLQNKKNWALTLVELLVVVGVIAVLAAIILPVNEPTKRRAQEINCVNNLKQVALSFRVWPSGQDDRYPMAISVTNGGAMEIIATGNVAGCFQVMSNELGTPKILICPAEIDHSTPATNFQNDFNNSHINYFINLDASESYPQQIMCGDDNLAVDGVAVKSGLVLLPSHAQVAWTAARHINVGNIGFADGSVSEVSDQGLQSALVLATNGTPTMINRLAIP